AALGDAFPVAWLLLSVFLTWCEALAFGGALRTSSPLHSSVSSSLWYKATSRRPRRDLALTMTLTAGERKQFATLQEGMRYKRLGNSDLLVSEVCLGTMTWGNQNTDEEAAAQLSLAFDEFGVNFIDTAEIYPVPPAAETQGNTDRAIAKWLRGRRREDVVLATKVAGRADQNNYLRESGKGPRVRRADVIESVEKSLARLGTDYVDLLQVHWPDRYVSLFGDEAYDYLKERPDDESFEEQLRALEIVVKAGKVRHIGLSNETPLGVCSFVQLAEREGLPRVVSVQNSYSLLVRADFELGGLAEACHPRNCNVGLLAYSPLAGGVLTGKYQGQAGADDDADADDDGNGGEGGGPLAKARLNLFKGYMARYRNSPSENAVKEYVRISEEVGLSPTQLALAWCYTRPYVASTIIGATSVDQLRENLFAYNCPITEEADELIREVYFQHTDPTKVRR
ncbi:unnamed protein product, partial [Phaeothamnion confervicola]